MRAAFYTLGCKVNQYETDAMRQDFLRDGFELVDCSQEADVYVVNSCTVTAGADSKTRQILRRLRRQNPAAVLALCGCFPQAFPEEAVLLPEADILLGVRGKSALLQSVKQVLAGGERVIDISAHQKGEAFEKMKVAFHGEKTRAFIKIQDGCERFCTYCIIPFARGPVRSKSLDDLKAELESLAAEGYLEVVLVGINLSSYGTDSGLTLLDAVRLAASVQGIQRVRLGSLEPELLTKEDIKALSGLEQFCPQFHLSLQSGSDSVLKRMHRPYDLAGYQEMVANIRSSFENAAITTDIMVGFPGETQEEHQQSLDFTSEIGLARAHVFAYSARPGTKAADLPSQVAGEIKSRRSEEMIRATNRTRQAFLEQQVGRVESVLFEAKAGEWKEGYTKNYTSVIVRTDEKIQRTLRKVRILSVKGEQCVGELV